MLPLNNREKPEHFCPFDKKDYESTAKEEKEEGLGLRRDEKGGRAITRQTRGDQLRNSIKVGHVSKCGAIPEVSNFLVKARKLRVS